jgi:hypothetical protein
MAACSWIAERLPCEANVELRSYGTNRVAYATQGTHIILAKIGLAPLGAAIPGSRHLHGANLHQTECPNP